MPVEKSDSSRAPLGPTTASGGAQDFGRGSTLLPARRGAIDGRGRAQPSIEGNSPEDLAELRSGAPGSDLSQGLAMPAGPARRAIASQTEDGGSGPSASQAGRLPRTQGEMGFNLPAAAKIVEEAALSGAGGVASNPGGQTSTLDVGQRIVLRRSGGSGTPYGNSGNAGAATAGIGDVLPGNDGRTEWHSVPRVAARGHGPSGPRRIEVGTPDGDDNGIGGVPRARTEAFNLRATATPVGPLAGTAGTIGGSGNGGTSQGSGAQSIGPSAGLGGIGRREIGGQGVGARPSSQVEPSEILVQIGVTSLQPVGR